MKTGSCLCGSVRYEIAGPIRASEYCHCAMCRKWHGSPFSANGEIDASRLRITEGAPLLREYESSPRRRRCFCSRCGSPLLIRRVDDPTTLVITLGSLDTDPDNAPNRHVFVDSKASWYEIADALPRFRIYPGFEPEE